MNEDLEAKQIPNYVYIKAYDEVVFPCMRLRGVTTLQACFELCPRYYHCDTAAFGNDALKFAQGEWEEDEPISSYLQDKLVL